MSTIVTRSGKGSPLTHTEVDDNFTNLNTDKYQSGDAVSFTTLTATGQTSLGGAAGSESLRVITRASADVYLQARGGQGGITRTTFGQEGTGSSGFNIYARAGNAIRFQTNGDGNSEQFVISSTASAVNYVQVTGAATGSAPTISAQGSDANARLVLTSKGGSAVDIYTNAAASIQARFAATGNGTNYLQFGGANTSGAPSVSAQGSDTNISQVFQSKGTGAIDLAAGSSGVNISNGGTVTALTVTSAGTTAYSSIPSVALSASTTSGGVQATSSATMRASTGSTTLASGGTGYTAGDVLTVSGGTFSGAVQITVNTVTAGAVATFTVSNAGSAYSVLPTNPVSVTGGTGSGATFNVLWFVNTLTITNAGSGYVEQPTVTFSGGGGSGAAAYATVGSGTVVKSIGSTMLFQTPGGTAFGVTDIANSVNYIRNQGSSSGFQVFSTVQGADTNTSYAITSKGNGAVSLYTNLGNQLQFTVAHTASAVNYVQVTGAATGGQAKVSSQGSDTNVGLGLSMKGWQNISFYSGNFGYEIFRNAQNTGTPANFLSSMAVAAGSSPAFQAIGSDTNIDLTLTPKGTGNVRFGTYTASVLTPTGYIEIKDSGGTIRRLLVG
jgi:hypothetical protein